MVTVKANAKINLTLDILSKRLDGYHEVEMVMQSVGLFDTIRMERQQTGISLQIDTKELLADETNLAWKAARLFLDVYRIQEGVFIEIEKRIPIAAGLAGGSADAAGVLIGMNILFGKRLTAEDLCALGEQIGSDIPFCIEGGTMLATGRGEILQRLPNLPPLFVVLAKPPVSVSTAWAYRNYDETGALYHPDTKKMIAVLSEGCVDHIASCLANVLEEVTKKEYTIIEAYKHVFMENGAIASLMSGSGPTVFALTKTKTDADYAAAALARNYPDAAVFVVSTVGRNNI